MGRPFYELNTEILRYIILLIGLVGACKAFRLKNMSFVGSIKGFRCSLLRVFVCSANSACYRLACVLFFASISALNCCSIFSSSLSRLWRASSFSISVLSCSMMISCCLACSISFCSSVAALFLCVPKNKNSIIFVSYLFCFIFMNKPYGHRFVKCFL